MTKAAVQVEAGHGGAGCVSFRREKCIPLGGPNGGDGGHGGSIYFVVEPRLTTLIDFRYQRHYRAQKGGRGLGSQCNGKNGDDLFIPVPAGTLVYDENTQELVADLRLPGEQVLIAKGGKRGIGNLRFKSSINRAPRQSTPGGEG